MVWCEYCTHTLALPMGLGSRLLAKLSYKLLYCLFKLFTLPSFASFSLLFADPEVHHTLILRNCIQLYVVSSISPSHTDHH